MEELAELQEELWDDIQGVQINGMVKRDDNEWGVHQALVDELRTMTVRCSMVSLLGVQRVHQFGVQIVRPGFI